MPSLKLEIFLVWTLYISRVASEYTPILDPGFFFDFNKPGQSVPIPITEQCERIHITWGRSTARGANPVAPYFMQIFTSTLTTPFVIPVGDGLTFDWDVPFAPGTQYQICMFDKNGLTGGCQAMYTVIQNSTTSQPTCQNVTAPVALEVDATVPGGPMSQYGFIDQVKFRCNLLVLFMRPMIKHMIVCNSPNPNKGIVCTHQYSPKVSPSLHPPYNITSNSVNPITWTVSLPWAFPFFISLSSADGQMWSNGPLHAGGFGPSDCLAPGSIPQKTANKIVIGAGIGSVVGGLMAGVLCSYYYIRYRRSHTFPTRDQKLQLYQEVDEAGRPPPISEGTDPGLTSHSDSNLEPQAAHITPYNTSPSAGYTTEASKTRHRNPQGLASSTISSSWSGSSRQTTTTQTLAYVIHEDAGHVSYPQISEVGNIVELPPRYMKNPEARAGPP
ncbi:hypothetical protein BDZ94DRAFT_412504 [Collybia nuda]|uniref:Uncharacterized protein n=1 Tax=Collybia nuda TaxID=64659 RepID=A0A9P5YAI0_9AGAR|nr:hypothetical protein BDZ94DRAFT_412504 [Collybia nuda]